MTRIRSRKVLFALVSLMALLFVGCQNNLVDDSSRLEKRGETRPVTVMTRNLYLGEDFNLLLDDTQGSLLQRTTKFWNTVQQTNFPLRARAIANEIAQYKPDLIGLQEVTLYRTDSPADGALTPAEVVVQDFLAILQRELKARGLNYRVENVIENIDYELPVLTATGEAIDVRMTDRDVILARPGVKTERPVARHYTINMEIPVETPQGDIVTVTALRGYVAVEAKVSSAEFTFVTTHLETESAPPIQQAQAQELLQKLSRIKGPVVLVGDFNSAADGSTTASYGYLTSVFKDAWAGLKPGVPGYTCCQAPHLDNPSSLLWQRIDLILHRNGTRAVMVDLLGESPGDRIGGLWPSDHAGVVATLNIER